MHKGKFMKKKVFLTIVLLGGLVAAVLFWLNCPAVNKGPGADSNDVQQTSVAIVKVGKTYGTAKVGGAFELVDYNGVTKTDADYKGKYMLVYFGYSFCPDICPAALYNMTQAFSELDSKVLALFNAIFITIDPQRDDVKNLKLYMKNFHPKFTALTGSDEQIKKAIKAYRVYAKKARADGSATDYLMDHSSIIYVMDRQGRFVTSFNHETDPATIKVLLSKYIQ